MIAVDRRHGAAQRQPQARGAHHSALRMEALLLRLACTCSPRRPRFPHRPRASSRRAASHRTRTYKRIRNEILPLAAGCAKSTALHACAHHGASSFPTGTRSTSRAGCAKSTTRPSRASSTRNRRADRRPAVGTCVRPEDPSVCAPRGFAPRLTKDSSASGSSIGARPDEP
jgi:hypothetical protein